MARCRARSTRAGPRTRPAIRPRPCRSPVVRPRDSPGSPGPNVRVRFRPDLHPSRSAVAPPGRSRRCHGGRSPASPPSSGLDWPHVCWAARARTGAPGRARGGWHLRRKRLDHAGTVAVEDERRRHPPTRRWRALRPIDAGSRFAPHARSPAPADRRQDRDPPDGRRPRPRSGPSARSEVERIS